MSRREESTVFLTDQVIAVSVWKIPRRSDYPLREDYSRSASHFRLLKPPRDALMQPITAITMLSMAELMKAILSILAHFSAGLIGLFRQTPQATGQLFSSVFMWFCCTADTVAHEPHEQKQIMTTRKQRGGPSRLWPVTCTRLHGAIAVLVHEHEPPSSEIGAVV